MQNMTKLLDDLYAATPFIGTALMGCILQALKQAKWQGWKNFTVSALSAGFGAWLVFNLVGEVLSPGWGFFASGMIGYSGGTLVDVMFAAFKKKVETYEGKQQ